MSDLLNGCRPERLFPEHDLGISTHSGSYRWLDQDETNYQRKWQVIVSDVRMRPLRRCRRLSQPSHIGWLNAITLRTKKSNTYFPRGAHLASYGECSAFLGPGPTLLPL